MDEIENSKPANSMREYLQNAREILNVLRWITKEIFTAQSKTKLMQMFSALAVVIVVQSIQPALIGFVFTGLADRNVGLIRFSLISIFFCLIIQKLGDRFQESAREWVIGLHWGKLEDRITELFFEKSIGQHNHEGSTLSVSNIDKGRWKLIDLQGMLLFEGIPAIAQLFVSLIFLAFLSLTAGIIMTVIIGIYIIWSIYLNFKVNQICTPIDRDYRRLNRRRLERWEHIERVKVSGKEQEEVNEMSEEFFNIIGRDRNFWLWFINQANIRGMINATGLVLVMSLGAWQVWQGNWEIGLLYPLFAWSTKVSENIWRLGAIEHQISWNIPAVKSMIEALNIKPAIVDVPDAKRISHSVPHRIAVKELTHTYPAETKTDSDLPPALKKVNFSIEPGEKVALLGPSGAGKTTVMAKLLRFSDPSSGEILIDGVNLKEICQASWRLGIGYIPQQSQIFDGTIRYNLTYGLSAEERAKVTDQELWNLMRQLQIDFGERLTDGLDTVVGKNGVKLSGGQAQRLMIGAAVMKHPWLLIVDEATSSLDSTTEKKVQAGLSAVLSNNKTSALIVAHRLSTVRSLCNKFVVLKPASKVVNGHSQVEAVANSFEELYKISPTFRELADDQGVLIQS